MKRANAYEAAFAEYLRQRQVPYVAVHEARRSLWADASMKNLDFIVSQPQGPSWLVDVKGRLFPAGRQRRYWLNWSTRDDLQSLGRWQYLFGPDFQAMLVFAYWVTGPRRPAADQPPWTYRGRQYAFFGIRVTDYMPHARLISPKWDTVSIPVRIFRQLAQPLERLLQPPSDQPAALVKQRVAV